MRVLVCVLDHRQAIRINDGNDVVLVLCEQVAELGLLAHQRSVQNVQHLVQCILDGDQFSRMRGRSENDRGALQLVDTFELFSLFVNLFAGNISLVFCRLFFLFYFGSLGLDLLLCDLHLLFSQFLFLIAVASLIRLGLCFLIFVLNLNGFVGGGSFSLVGNFLDHSGKSFSQVRRLIGVFVLDLLLGLIQIRSFVGVLDLDLLLGLVRRLVAAMVVVVMMLVLVWR